VCKARLHLGVVLGDAIRSLADLEAHADRDDARGVGEW
jgi:hypothetical protein